MPTLTHYRFCPRSRSIRLALAELSLEVELTEESPWAWRPEFLALNPAGELPVLVFDDGPTLLGAYAISEYLAETPQGELPPSALALFPGQATERAEVRRLVDWAHGKLDREVTRELVVEKIEKLANPGAGTAPDTDVLRAVRANLRYHLSYIAFLATARGWLAGQEASFADLAAGAHLSVADYLGEVPWEEHPAAKQWYVRLKSRPSFRGLLADRLPGLPPPAIYADLDF